MPKTFNDLFNSCSVGMPGSLLRNHFKPLNIGGKEDENKKTKSKSNEPPTAEPAS
jgi:hypothetical protein